MWDYLHIPYPALELGASVNVLSDDNIKFCLTLNKFDCVRTTGDAVSRLCSARWNPSDPIVWSRNASAAKDFVWHCRLDRAVVHCQAALRVSPAIISSQFTAFVGLVDKQWTISCLGRLELHNVKLIPISPSRQLQSTSAFRLYHLYQSVNSVI